MWVVFVGLLTAISLMAGFPFIGASLDKKFSRHKGVIVKISHKSFKKPVNEMYRHLNSTGISTKFDFGRRKKLEDVEQKEAR